MLIYRNDRVEVYAVISADSAICGRAETECAKAALLAEALPAHPQVTIGHRPDGAPVLENAPRPLAISISHSRRVVAMAIATSDDIHSIGIDTETPDRAQQLQRIAPRFLSPHQLKSNDNATELLRAWTIKEALYKAAGIPGWALRDIPLPPPGADCVTLPSDGRHLRLIDIPLPTGCGIMTLALPILAGTQP